MSKLSPNNLYTVDFSSPEDGSGGGVSGGGESFNVRDGDRTIFLCEEFLNVYPTGYLSRFTAWWIFVLLVAGGSDVATMRHVIGVKFTDAFGNVTESGAVIWGAALFTLMVFFLISFLWSKGSKK